MATVTSQASTSSRASYTPTDTEIPVFSIGPSTNTTCKTSYTNGTAADKIDLLHRKTYTLAAAPTVLDLNGGTLLDPLGNACAFARIRRIRIKFLDTTDGHTLKLGYSTTTTNAWTGLLSNPGQLTLQASSAANDAWIEINAPNTTGMAVSSTNKLLQLDPGSSTYTIILEIDGCSS